MCKTTGILVSLTHAQCIDCLIKQHYKKNVTVGSLTDRSYASTSLIKFGCMKCGDEYTLGVCISIFRFFGKKIHNFYGK